MAKLGPMNCKVGGALVQAEEDADRLEDTLEDLTERAAQLLGAKSGSD